VTITPPTTAIRGDPATFAREKERAEKNFLQMATFKPPKSDDSENTSTETRV